MPNYNKTDLLPEVIDSVIGQTYKDWQLIIVDDGSTDSSQQILDYYAKNPKIKVIYAEHKGISSARQTALDASQGDYIAIIDSDTPMHEEKLRLSLKHLKKTGADIVYTGTFAVMNNKIVKPFMPFEISKIIKKPSDILDRKNKDANQVVPNYTILAKRKCFDDKTYREDFTVNDDLWTIYYWAKQGYKFELLKDYLMYHISDMKNTSITQQKLIKEFTEKLRQEEGI
jgi:glycosyltransferase involved in cell wall biosynthesis